MNNRRKATLAVTTALLSVLLLFVAPRSIAQDIGGFFGNPTQPRFALFANLGTPTNGNFRYCTDCAVTAPCTGGGTGAFAYRVGSAWNCTNGSGAAGYLKADGTTTGATSQAQSFTNGVTTAGNLTFSAASAKILPGATSLLFRDTADANTNMTIADAGNITVRGTVTANAAKITLGSTAGTKAWIDTNGNIGMGGLLSYTDGITGPQINDFSNATHNHLNTANGGTLTTIFPSTAYALLAGGTTNGGADQQLAGVGTSGQVLTSNGAGALPTFQAASSGVTNAAGANVVPKSNGTNLVASGVSDDGTTITTPEAVTQTSASATAFQSGANGATNPGVKFDFSTASSATGVAVKSAAAGAGIALNVLSSGTNEDLKINPKGTGKVNVTATTHSGNVLMQCSPDSGASFVRIYDNGTMTLDSDTGSGSIPLLLRYAGADRYSFAYTGAFTISGASASILMPNTAITVGGRVETKGIGLVQTATKTANYTSGANDGIIPVDPSAGGFTITLSSANAAAGSITGAHQDIWIINVTTSTNVVLLSPSSGNINGVSTWPINAGYGATHVIFNGTNWFTNEQRGRMQSCSVGSDQTNATTTLATTACYATTTGSIPINLAAGRTYVGQCQLFLSDSVAADGAKIDFNGGTATATNFRAQITAFDTALNLSTQTTALNSTGSASTFTGNGAFEIHMTFKVNAAGTFQPEFAQVAHTAGTLTLAQGSYCKLEDVTP